jgi:hypothetical protein
VYIGSPRSIILEEGKKRSSRDPLPHCFGTLVALPIVLCHSIQARRLDGSNNPGQDCEPEMAFSGQANTARYRIFVHALKCTLIIQTDFHKVTSR